MRVLRSALLLSALTAGVALMPAAPAAALPLSPQTGLAAQYDEALPSIQVRSRSGRIAAGVIGGLIVGGLIASQLPRYHYGYPYGYGYYAPYPVYRGYPAGDAVAYCMRRFKSYDPYSGTYLGYDGYRHPCP
jgi:hypothetical protein